MPKPQSSPGLRRGIRPKDYAGPVALFLLALTVFGWNLAAEPHFVDESAYISQAFYADLLIEGKVNDPSWLTYAGYDLPPLPKYVIGWTLRVAGYRRPGPSAMVAWYQDTSRQFVSRDALVVARYPSVFLGAVGCLAIYAIGTLASDAKGGWLAALLLLVNPLYTLHARRAMSDVYAESLILATAAVGLWGWKRLLESRTPRLAFVSVGLGAGILAGLATLSKLNGALAAFNLIAWSLLALAVRQFPTRARVQFLLATLLACVMSFGTFAALNPFLYAHPTGTLTPAVEPSASQGFWARVKAVSDHRVNVSARAKDLFPNDALRTLAQKNEVVRVQGFGRFGPFGPRGRSDSTIRFDPKQDWGAYIWLPLVVVSTLLVFLRGRAEIIHERPPVSWAVLVQAGLATLVVTLFIPLAWDRYFLSIQPGYALVVAIAVVTLVNYVSPTLRGVGSSGEVEP